MNAADCLLGKMKPKWFMGPLGWNQAFIIYLLSNFLAWTGSGSCFDCAIRFAELMITLLQVRSDQSNKVFR